MKQRQPSAIILPEYREDLPVRIIGNPDREAAVPDTIGPDPHTAGPNSPADKDVLIWRQNDYLKVSLDEIQWIEADGSYSIAHLTCGRDLTISFNLSVVHRELPDRDFVRMHRSYVINLRHMESLTGNCVKIGDKLLTIGREYREAFFSRFIFLGVRRRKK